ncbi:MAG TPA: AI-2E family transporter [Methylomirabilota bacterium]|jgi:predicted PurR-regulated permease PerM|nr:AI-2E family transporter [Methylomirabilota bacterium]
MRATAYEVAAWVLVAAGVLFVLVVHLVPALVAGLFVTVLLHRLTGLMVGRRLPHGAARLVAAGLMGLLVVGVASGIVLGLLGLIRGRAGDVPALFQTMAEVLDQTRLWLERRGGPALVPDALRDADDLQRAVADWLRAHAAALRRTGGELGRMLLHVAAGIAIGLMVFFRQPRGAAGPLAKALEERLRRLAAAFEAIVFAQVWISAVNTLLTALYLLVALPLAGIHLPLAGTLVAVTFITGLLPAVGNLISNTVIVIISLGVSVWVAVASLTFLVVIHKLEYVVNARIVGSRIRAAAWELLVALVAMEAAFGVPGVVLAPILYAYVKQELVDRGLI